MKIIFFALRWTLAFLGFGLFFTACQKEAINEALPSTSQVTNTTTSDLLRTIKKQNETLVFEDANHFQAVYSVLRNDDLLLYQSIEEAHDFQSLRSQLEEARQALFSEGFTSTKLLNYFDPTTLASTREIAFPFYPMSGLLNSDGAVYLGQQLVQFTNEFVYTILDGNYAKISTTSNLKREGNHDGIYTLPVNTWQTESQEERNTVTHYCNNTSSNGEYFLLSKVRAYSYAIPTDLDQFLNFLDIDLYVQKFEVSGQSYIPYDCGGAAIDAGSLTYLWVDGTEIVSYGDSVRTNFSNTHIFHLETRNNIWRTHTADVNLFLGNHGTTGEFRDKCVVGRPNAEDMLSCNVQY